MNFVQLRTRALTPTLKSHIYSLVDIFVDDMLILTYHILKRLFGHGVILPKMLSVTLKTKLLDISNRDL